MEEPQYFFFSAGVVFPRPCRLLIKPIKKGLAIHQPCTFRYEKTMFGKIALQEETVFRIGEKFSFLMTVLKLLTAVPAGSLQFFRLRQNALSLRFNSLQASPEILIRSAPLLYHNECLYEIINLYHYKQ
jgi:hypothetical protein